MNRRRFLLLGLAAVAFGGCDRSASGALDVVRSWGTSLAKDRPDLAARADQVVGLSLTAMRRRAVADIEEGRTVTFEGWVLSETEALYAVGVSQGVLEFHS
jgi:hypothetical protein